MTISSPFYDAADRLFSTRLMWVRVGFQAFTLLLLAAAVVLRQ